MTRSSMRMRGFTLVEVMVAITIGLIVLAAVAQIFATSRGTYRLEENLARVQESGRFAVEFLTRDLRMAGYAGCVNINQALNANANYTATNHLNPSTPPEATNFMPGEHLRGFHYNDGTGDWEPPLPTGIFSTGEVNANTDVVLIRRGSPNPMRVTTPYMVTDASALQLPVGNDLQIGDIVMVSDCTNVDIFQITGPDVPDTSGTLNHNTGTGTPGNATQPLSKTYAGDAEIMELFTQLYYVGTGASGEPALMRKDLAGGTFGPGQELVEGVESLRVLYGEDTNGDRSADIYVLPAAVTDWTRVVSIRVGLLVRTPQQSGQDPDTRVYNLLADAGSTADDFDPVDDKRQRRLFSSTIQVRNMRTD